MTAALDRYQELLAQRPSRLRLLIHKWWPAAAVMVAVVAFWELFLIVTGAEPYVLPPLSEILTVGYEQWSRVFWPNARVTLIEILLGFVLSLWFGLTLAIVIFQFDVLNRGLMPYIIGSQAIPTLALAPIFIIWFGFNIWPKLLIIVLICFFPVVINTIAGFRSVERDALNLMESLGARERDVFLKVRLPAAMPHIFIGVRLCAVLSPIGAFVGEYIGSDWGIAPLMVGMLSAFRTAEMFMGIFLLAFMAIVLFLLVVVAERLMIPWYFIDRGRREDNG